jgi:SAM-dependent methyltransferase
MLCDHTVATYGSTKIVRWNMVDAGVGSRQYFEEIYASRTWEYYRPIVAHVVVNSAPGPILDIGAGTGLFVEAATRWGLDCQGIEGSEEAVAMGEKRYPGLRLSRHYLSAPLPFAGEQFQTILLHQVIAHLEPEVARRVLAESRRALRRGGLLLIFSPGRFNKAVRRVSPACEAWMQTYAPSEMRELVRSAGFRNVVPLDTPRELLGKNLPGRLAMRAAFRLTHWDRLSATANCQASKP